MVQMKNLPKGWEWRRLREITDEIQTGFAFGAFDKSIGVIHLRPYNITKDGRFLLNELKYVPDDSIKSEKYLLGKGDLIFNSTNSEELVGKTAIFNDNLKCTFSNHITKIRFNGKIANPYYMWILFNFYYRIGKFKPMLKRWVNQVGVEINRLKELEILLPPLPTQQKIVSILERAERLKQRREQTNDETNKIIQSLFYEMFGDPILNLKNFPKTKLGSVSDISMGGTPNTGIKEYYENGNINWMKSGDIKDDFIKYVPHKITELGLKNSNTKIYKKGNVVIALNGQGKTRATTGILGVDTASNQSVASISPKNKIKAEYLHFNLKVRYKQLRGLTGDEQRSGLNLTILRNLEIPIPPISLQSQFASLVEKIESIKQKQTKSTADINTLFDALMQKAFQGELIA